MALRARWWGVALALLVCVGAVAPVRARCARTGLEPRVLTPTSTSLPRDGGAIVLGMLSSPGEGAPMPTEVRLVRGRHSQELVATELAPGLVRFAAALRLTPGTFSVPALGPAASVIVGRTPLPGVPTRPSVVEMRRVAATGVSARRLPRAEVRAQLEHPVPPGIVAIVAAWGADGAASAWQPAIEGQREVVVWREPGRCESVPAGTVAPPEGEGGVGRIAFVDAFGQMSPLSEAVAVR